MKNEKEREICINKYTETQKERRGDRKMEINKDDKKIDIDNIILYKSEGKKGKKGIQRYEMVREQDVEI